MTTQNIRWSARFSYVIGLIATDGNLSSDGRHLDFTSKDLDQVKNFKQILALNNNKIGLKSSGSSNKIKKYYCIRFGNVKLYKFLVDIGLTPHKSKTLGPLNIPDKYFIDFLRGHLDGDGSIVSYIDKYNFYKGRNYTNHRVVLYFISASKTHIDWLSNQISRLLDIRGTLAKNIPANSNHSTMWRLKFSKKLSLELLKYIYYKPNLPCLRRKEILAKSILEIIPKETRRKYTKVT